MKKMVRTEADGCMLAGSRESKIEILVNKRRDQPFGIVKAAKGGSKPPLDCRDRESRNGKGAG